MARAFVIMPFDPSMQAVYSDFIRPAVESVGFEVERADDLLSQRNILQDIIEAIEQADLIIADLTGSNPNVFYELGIAHTRMRPTILLTQDVEDVPFDLRSYRLIPYSTHFADIGNAQEALRKHAQAAADGSMPFGNPVADYLRHEPVTAPSLPSDLRNESLEEEEPLGLIDHSESLETGLHRMTEIMTEVTSLTESISTLTVEATDELKRTGQTMGSNIPYGHIRRIANRLATGLKSFTEELSARNEEYRNIADSIDASFEFLVRYSADSQEHEPERDEWLTVLEQVKGQASNALAAYEDLADTMESTPPFEKSLAKAIKEASRQIRSMADNIKLTIASIDRALVASGR